MGISVLPYSKFLCLGPILGALIIPLTVKTFIMKQFYLTLITLLLVASSQAQNPDFILSSPGTINEEIFSINENLTEDLSYLKTRNFREVSVGLLYMPIPLNFERFTIFQDGVATVFNAQGLDENAFDFEFQGYGISANFDFHKSGKGLGLLGYYAIIDGGSLTAEDIFVAFKYDLIFDIDLPIEISPLIGVGSLNFSFDDTTIGSSLYVGGGARFTWLISNTIILGADVQSIPLILNEAKFLGVEDTAEEAKVQFKFLAQANLSLRFNLFKN